MKKEISLVIGTAGHIDHGKTSLVKALTGVECDRLTEEQKRGITIELGFAPLTLPSERVISIVDVPGHEKFIRQMVAGASGLDGVVLVVAADEGVMPQTREHLDIIELLGVKEGFVVLTKTDLVDDEMTELAADDVTELIKGTFLEGKPIIPVSSVTGKNLDLVLRELDRLVDRTSPRERTGAFFMPIDRAFPVAGFGTVVTGTAYRGTVSQGDGVDVLPAGLESRIRSIQVHGASVRSAQAGQRVAVSLAGLSVEQLTRGDVACASGVFRPSRCLEVSVRLLSGVADALGHWQRVRVHLGTSDVLARVALLDRKELLPGDTCVAQMVLEEPVVASLCQKYVIRFYSPLRTIGGGDILSPYGKKAHGRKAREETIRRLERLLKAATREDRIAALVDHYGRIPMGDLIVQTQETGNGLEEVIKAAAKKEDGPRLLKVGNGVVLSAAEWKKTESAIVSLLKDFHSGHPNQDGMAPDKIVNSLFPEGERKLGKAFLDQFLQKGGAVLRGGFVSLADFSKKDDHSFNRDLAFLTRICEEAAFQPPTLEFCFQKMGMDEKAFSAFIDDVKGMGHFTLVDGTFLLSSSVEKKLIALLKEAEGGITIASVRDLTGSSRKFILPLLEYLDGRGVTRRVGDRRIVVGGGS